MRENILKIESDPTHRIIRVGDREFDKPFFLHHYTEISGVFGVDIQGRTFTNRKNGKKQGNKAYNEALSEALGMPPTVWKRRFNYEMGLLWVDPVKQFSYLFRGFRGKLNLYRLKEVWDTKEDLLRAIDDGQENLIPLIFTFKSTPSELKKLFGKGEWKRLCKNSRTRNALICSSLGWSERTKDEMRAWIKKANQVPSTVFLYDKNITESLLWAIKNRERPLKDEYETRNLRRLFSDTARMSQRLGAEFNSKWSHRKMVEKHEEFTNRINEARYGTKPFDYENTRIEFGEYTADLLMNPKEVASEGSIMRHCVASYAEECSFGHYAVFSIKKNGEHYSTLGLRKTTKDGVPYWKFSQHYKACNQRVDDVNAEHIAQLALESMNEVNV